jgi:hypothetical protein
MRERGVAEKKSDARLFAIGQMRPDQRGSHTFVQPALRLEG